MSRLLASVTTIAEAIVALECGADIIDLKNPSQGALGALPLELVREIVRTVDGKRQVSATVGDLPMTPDILCNAVTRMAETGADIVKVGFFGRENHHVCADALASCAKKEIRIVAVLFADDHPPLDLLPRLSAAGFHGVMLDTAIKNGKRLTQHLDNEVLSGFVAEAKRLDLLTGLAGSLSIDDLPGLLPLKADYLGFRGALCDGANRIAGLEQGRLSHLINVLHYYNNPSEELMA